MRLSPSDCHDRHYRRQRVDYRLEVKEVEKEGGEERSISSTRKTVRKIDNAKDTFQVQERGREKER